MARNQPCNPGALSRKASSNWHPALNPNTSGPSATTMGATWSFQDKKIRFFLYPVPSMYGMFTVYLHEWLIFYGFHVGNIYHTYHWIFSGMVFLLNLKFSLLQCVSQHISPLWSVFVGYVVCRGSFGGKWYSTIWHILTNIRMQAIIIRKSSEQPIPYDPCMVYLRTFTIKMNQM